MKTSNEIKQEIGLVTLRAVLEGWTVGDTYNALAPLHAELERRQIANKEQARAFKLGVK
jgi:hypothetical protein